MKFTSFILSLVASLFLFDSTLALPAPRCRRICQKIRRAAKKVGSGIKKAAKKVGSGIKKAAKVVHKAVTSKVGKMVLGGVAMATGMGGVLAAAKLANKAVDVAKSK
jgi:hypothetical protein